MTGEEPMDHLTSILIADSAEEFCSGLTSTLQRFGGFQVVGTANDGEQAIRMILEKKPQTHWCTHADTFLSDAFITL